MKHLPTGRYRHYKGGEYDVYGVARHSESDERLVVYRPRYGERELWVRPLSMFLESVELDGVATPRFALIPEHGEDSDVDTDSIGDGGPPGDV